MKNELTTKDLMSLNELMTFENWIAIKMKLYSDTAEDKKLKTLFQEMAEKHLDNHSKLLAYLKNNGVGGEK